MTGPSEPLAFSFDAEHAFPAEELVEHLGGKGAGLAAMVRMGLPVPPGFTLTTGACRRYFARGWDEDLDRELRQQLASLEAVVGRRLGDPDAPLLVSVRSGGATSMPGMLDTVLDVGITPAVADGLARRTGDRWFAQDTLARAIAAGVGVGLDPIEQVVRAVQDVFDSWRAERAAHYRRIEDIAEADGTAATVQAMVFGNLDEDSGTGVAFSRDPSTGAPGLTGDFLPRPQGEDVVTGDHLCLPLSEVRQRWPHLWDELERVAGQLERWSRDMVDIEFTVESGRLWLLQVRTGKRSPLAVFRTAVDMAEDDAFPLDRAEAVRRCRRLLADPPVSVTNSEDVGAGADGAVAIGRGLAASPGTASGVLVTDIDDAVARGAAGERVVLVRGETSPADIRGIAAAVALVTTRGGLVSHAAIVARSWGLPCVVGASELQIIDGDVVGPGGRVAVGSVVTVDGTGGCLLAGSLSSTATEPSAVAVIRRWADELGEPT